LVTYKPKPLPSAFKGLFVLEKGKGTVVSIKLPLKHITDFIPEDSNSEINTYVNNNIYSKILIFEDDISLGNMIREFLTQKGFKVKLCSNTRDIKGFIRLVSSFDIVFTDMQMLRSLQEKRIRSIGTSLDIDVDVRIITATNENLELAISEGKFREDLYHRLNEFMIRVPSLRECVEDIKLYAEHFREEANIELDKNVRYISDDAMEMLERYDWPGNLRELRNVIRRSVLFSSNDEITLENLPILTQSVQEIDNNIDIALFPKPENEKEKIITALKKTNGNKSKAAILLNIDRKTFYNKIHLYNIDL
jgi:DNA-binding NtrC family response regulator